MRKIALIGLKSIGKDYLFSKFSKMNPNSKRFAIGDVLKIESWTNYKDWQSGNYLKEDFLYLKEKIKNNSAEDIMTQSQIEFIDNISDFDKLENEMKLLVLEITKNIDECRSRESMNIFGTYMRHTTGNSSYFLDKLIEHINNYTVSTEKGYVFVNDCRYITELLDFLIDDFFVVKLENKSLYDSMTKSGDLHPTEIELSSYEKPIGVTLDMEGSVEISGIKRRNDQEMSSNIFELLEFSRNFDGYSETDRDTLISIKENFLKDEFYKQLYKDYTDGLQSKGENFELIKNQYYKCCFEYVDKINSVIGKYY